MTQETKHLAVESSSSNDNSTLEDVKQLLQTSTNMMRTSLHTKASTAKILTNLQECPCLFKCDHEIRNTDYSNTNFDPLYGAKHEYAKNKIIDAIVDRFTDLIDISSEQSIPNGKLDIAIKPGSKIILNFNRKIIAIELKSGKSADAKMLHQIERYMPDCDVLIFVRIHTEEVTLIETEPLKASLIENLSRVRRKIHRLTNGELTKVQGDWCKGCNAQCDYKQPPRWNGEYKASLANYGEFMKNIENVISKTLDALEKLLR